MCIEWLEMKIYKFKSWVMLSFKSNRDRYLVKQKITSIKKRGHNHKYEL